MKAWLLDKISGLDALRLGEMSDPVPAGENDVVVKLEFAALNPADRYLSEGHYPANPPMPHILGRDGIGTAVAAGTSKSAQALLNKRVMILRGDTGVTRPGTFAQSVLVDADQLVQPPPDWTPQQAGCAALVYLTAHIALTDWSDLPKDPVVLITGASGGVGVASVQLARAMGFTVIALSRSPEKRKKLLELGAHHAIDPSENSWPRRVTEAVGKNRVNLAIDNIGGSLFPQVIETLAFDGRISVVGRLAGPVGQFNTSSLLFRHLRIGGVAVGLLGAARARESWKKIVALLKRTDARPVIDRTFAFPDLRAAFYRLAVGPMGKVLLEIP
jgi:NADPH2:quinone reductase